MSHPNADRVVAFAAARGVTITPIEFPEGTKTAADAARAIGCQLGQIVKSLVFSVDDELIMALVEGSHRVDLGALGRLAGGSEAVRADPEAVRAATGYPIGGVPPFGHESALRTWLDVALKRFDVVWAAAGTPRHVFEISVEELVRLCSPELATFTS